MRSTRNWAAAGACLAAIQLAACRPGSETAGSVEARAAPDPSDVLRRMVTAYQRADQYEDSAVARLIYRRDGVLYESEVDSALRFERPNRLALRSNQFAIASDGTRVTARLIDPESRHLDGQVLSVAAPAVLTPEALYALDSLVDAAVRSGMTGYPVQLDLLAAVHPLDALLAPESRWELLEPALLERRRCRRVALSGSLGRFVFWIDEADDLLRRLEYPAESFAPEAAGDPAVTELELYVDFRDARWQLSNTVSDAGSFAIELPEAPRFVRTFMSPPAPLPSPLLGQVPGEFSFVALDETVVGRGTLSDRIIVLAWFNEHPACRVTLEQVDRVARATHDDRVGFYGVATIPSTAGHDPIGALAREWDLSLPVVRDPNACGRDVFQIPGAPTVVILDPRGKIQFYEVGANPELVQELPGILERLVSGEDIAAARLEQFRRDREEYESALSAGGPPAADARQSRSGPQQGTSR